MYNAGFQFLGRTASNDNSDSNSNSNTARYLAFMPHPITVGIDLVYKISPLLTSKSAVWGTIIVTVTDFALEFLQFP